MASTKNLGDFAASVSVDPTTAIPSLNTVPASGDNTSKVAPMSRVKEALDTALSAAQAASNAQTSADSVVYPGDFKHSARASNHGRWMIANGLTIGSAASGATGKANANTFPCYEVLWNDWSNAVLPIQTSTGSPTTRGVSAAADFAANKRLPLPDMRGLSVRSFHFGSSAYETDVARTIGSIQGDQNKSHTHGIQAHSRSGSAPGLGDGGPGNTYYVEADYTGGPEVTVRNRALATFIYV